MSHNQHIADHVEEIAARRLRDPDPEVRAMAGEIMRLSQNRTPLGPLANHNALTIARRYTEGGKSVFEDTDRPRSTLADVLLFAPGAHKRYK